MDHKKRIIAVGATGTNPRRQDAIEKVTGQAKYTGNLALPGLLEGRVLRSVFPHALVESIDTQKAEALKGVVAVLTREDLKDIDPYYGHCLRDRPLIAIDRVRYVGEPVAVVAAEKRELAEEALSLIDVRYKELPCLSARPSVSSTAETGFDLERRYCNVCSNVSKTNWPKQSPSTLNDCADELTCIVEKETPESANSG